MQQLSPALGGALPEAHPHTLPPLAQVLILGGGPNRIGQGIEFDYCCCHASFALRHAGYETIMMNCNPETVSTDYDTSSRLFFEPVTLEDVLNVLDKERPNGIIVQFGGQTPLKISTALQKALDENPIPTADGVLLLLLFLLLLYCTSLRPVGCPICVLQLFPALLLALRLCLALSVHGHVAHMLHMAHTVLLSKHTSMGPDLGALRPCHHRHWLRQDLGHTARCHRRG
jgi:hypothetical protein